MSPQEIEFEYDMAMMDLQSKRYRAAEEKFKALAMASNSPEAWCGLGIAKYGLIMENTGIEEVFYCFGKAKITDETKASELEVVVIEISIEIVKNLYDVLLLTRQSIDNARVQQTRAAITTMAGAILTARNSHQGRLTATLTTGTLTAISFNGYVKAGATINEMQSLHKKTQSLIRGIQGALQSYVKNETGLLDKFNSIIADAHAEVTINIPARNEINRLQKKSNKYKTWSFIIFAFVGIIFGQALWDAIFSDTFSFPDFQKAIPGTLMFAGIAILLLYKSIGFRNKAKDMNSALNRNNKPNAPVQRKMSFLDIPSDQEQSNENQIKLPPPLPNRQ